MWTCVYALSNDWCWTNDVVDGALYNEVEKVLETVVAEGSGGVKEVRSRFELGKEWTETVAGALLAGLAALAAEFLSYVFLSVSVSSCIPAALSYFCVIALLCWSLANLTTRGRWS